MHNQLKHFFQPVKVRPWKLLPEQDAVVSSIVRLHDLEHLQIADFQVAIAGIDESVNSCNNLGCRLTPQLIRPYLYGLRRNSRSVRILELGNVLGNSIIDKYVAMREVARYFSELQIPLIVIGGSQDFTIPLYVGMQSVLPDAHLCVVDALMDDGGSDEALSNNFLMSLRNSNAVFPDHVSLVATQKYLVGNTQDEIIADNGMKVLRLGDLRGDGIHLVEPVLRDTHCVSFDVSAIAHADMPGQAIPMPNGLSAHQACQIGWYAGLSDQMRVFGLFELTAETDVTGSSVILAAQIFWHVIEGIAFRYGDYPMRSLDSYANFHVCQDEIGLDIQFFCNPTNNRWWVELKNDDCARVIACSEADYKNFCEGSVPEQWWVVLRSMDCPSVENQF
ncbi:MAG: arginase family protein [Marinilabiliaceae bacterium]|nr:arginase family protein [Marinilabiliaceae bacterium]